jgi:alkylation response protein AidB-like acyl-CoA dehydrogenase
MIAFTPTDEQQMLIEATHRFADHDLRKIAHDADEKSVIDPAAIQKGWELGILPGLIPEKYGGYAGEQSTVTATLALEELAWGDLSIAMHIWTPSLFALPLLLSGTETQKRDFLPLFCDDTSPEMTAALMEPGILFNVWQPTTTARRQGNKIILSGAKTYVPLADSA